MIYELVFDDEALKEWKKLPPQIKEQFKTKLRERVQNPKVPKDKLSSMKDVYKLNYVRPVIASPTVLTTKKLKLL